MEKALYTIEQSCDYAGVGKTSIYEALALGKLRARKYGRKTLIEADSLREFVAALPSANFKAKPETPERPSRMADKSSGRKRIPKPWEDGPGAVE